MRTDPNSAISLLAALLFPLLATGCHSGGEGATRRKAPTGPTAGVLQAMDAGTYTYVELDVDGEAIWFAGPKISVAKGDTVLVPSRSMPMRDFPSEALDRTFDLVYFVEEIRKVDGPDPGPDTDTDPAQAVEQAHESAKQSAADSGQGDIPKAEGGLTVAEVFALGKEGAGQDIVLRGKVVKYNADILGKNWLHVRDGTGAEGENDIVVTTGDAAAVGDTVLVRGELAADRDLGSGYKFDLLIEDATVTVE